MNIAKEKSSRKKISHKLILVCISAAISFKVACDTSQEEKIVSHNNANYKLTITRCPGGATTGNDLVSGDSTDCFSNLNSSRYLPFFSEAMKERGGLLPPSIQDNYHGRNSEAARLCEHYAGGDWKAFLDKNQVFNMSSKLSFLSSQTLFREISTGQALVFFDVNEQLWKRVELGEVEQQEEESSSSFTTNTPGYYGPGSSPDNFQTTKSLQNEVVNVVEAIKEGVKKTTLFCQALANITNKKNYSDDAFSSDDNYNSMKSNPQFAYQQCMGRPDAQLCMMQANQMVEMKCSHEGPITLDYKACKKIVMTIDGFFMGNQVVEAVQGVQATSKAQEQALDQQTKLMKGEGFNETYGLELQKTSTETQANMAGQRAAINAAELGVLAGLLNSMPSRKKVKEECLKKDKFNDSFANSWIASNASISDDNEKIEACEQVAYDPYIPGLFQNLNAKEAVKTAMFEAGRNAAENAAKMAILNDQAGKIQGAINDINAYQPQEYDNTPFCQANPEDPLCKVPTVGRGEIGTDVVTGDAFTVDDGSAFEDVLNEDPNVSYGGTNNDSSNGGFLDDGPSIGGAKTTPTSHGGGGGGGGPGNVAAPGGGGPKI